MNTMTNEPEREVVTGHLASGHLTPNTWHQQACELAGRYVPGYVLIALLFLVRRSIVFMNGHFYHVNAIHGGRVGTSIFKFVFHYSSMRLPVISSHYLSTALYFVQQYFSRLFIT